MRQPGQQSQKAKATLTQTASLLLDTRPPTSTKENLPGAGHERTGSDRVTNTIYFLTLSW